MGRPVTKGAYVARYSGQRISFGVHRRRSMGGARHMGPGFRRDGNCHGAPGWVKQLAAHQELAYQFGPWVLMGLGLLSVLFVQFPPAAIKRWLAKSRPESDAAMTRTLIFFDPLERRIEDGSWTIYCVSVIIKVLRQ